MADAQIHVTERGSIVEELLPWVWKDWRGAKLWGPETGGSPHIVSPSG